MNEATILRDFEGRRLTAVVIGIAALGSASLNVWGATQIFPQWQTATVFAVVVSMAEVIAFLGLRSIMADHANNRYWKAHLGSLILCLAITCCLLSGHRAFHTLSLEAEARHATLVVEAAGHTQAAERYAAIYAESDTDINRSRWETRLRRAEEAKLTALKAKPVSPGLVYVFLALFEIMKIGGLWALATPSSKGQTRTQRIAQRRMATLRRRKSEAEFKAKLEESLTVPQLVVSNG